MIITAKDLAVFALIAAILAFFLAYDLMNWDRLDTLTRAAAALTALLGMILLLLESGNLKRRCAKVKEFGSWEGVSDVRVPFLGDFVGFSYLSHPVRFGCRLSTGKMPDAGTLNCELSTQDEGPDIDYLRQPHALSKELDAFAYTYKLTKAMRVRNRLIVGVAMAVDLRKSRPWPPEGDWESEKEFSKKAILDSLRLVNRLREKKE
jgi:hypothetical protein